MKALRTACLGAILGIAGCASSSELIGHPRPPTLPQQVHLYLEAPVHQYDQIAFVRASSKRSFSFSAQGKAEVVIRRLKEQAAKLGANGIVLQGISDESHGSLGTSAGAQYEGARGTVDLGVGASALLLQREGRAIAIYLPP